MKTALKQLKAMLLAEKFVVTGSFVLAEYGIIDYSKVKDLDVILVNPQPSVFEMLENLMSTSPAKTTKQFLEIRDSKPSAHPIPANTTNGKAKYIDEDEDDIPAKKKLSDCVKPASQSTLKPIAIFQFNNFKVDVYHEDRFCESTLNVDGLEYASVKRIVEAKKNIGRMKDLLQLRDIARIFFKSEEFSNLLNNTNNWQQALREEY